MRIEFRCGTCGYAAMVSGGNDIGGIGYTTTVLCEDCEELYDVFTYRRMALTEDDRLGRIEPACPKSGGHSFRLWKDPDACPRCENSMARGEKWMIWD